MKKIQPHTHHVIILVGLLLSLALTDRACGQDFQPKWRVRPLDLGLPKSDFTIAFGVGNDAVVLRGTRITYLKENGSQHSPSLKLPFPTGKNTSSIYDGKGGIIYGDGNQTRIYRIDMKTWKLTKLPNIRPRLGPSFRLCLDDQGNVIHIGRRAPVKMAKLVNNKWQDLCDVITMNQIGSFSRGIYPIPGGLLAFGDHHIGSYDRKTNKWAAKKDLVGFMGLRPAIHRGGMSTQDHSTQAIFITLGKGSRSFGVFSPPHRIFYHLRPRLPFGVDHGGETMFMTGEGPSRRLNIIYPKLGQIADIPFHHIRRIGPDGFQTDSGSQVELVMTEYFGNGELVREIDSICNIATVGNYAYVFRKNVLRRFKFKPLEWGANMTGFRYGPNFAKAGSTLTSDGVGHFYLCNGHDQKFFKADLTKNGTFDAKNPPMVKDIRVTPARDLPEKAQPNAAYAWGGGYFWAVLDPTEGHIWKYDPKDNEWSKGPSFPKSESGVANQEGCVLVGCQDDLVLIRHDQLYQLNPKSETTWRKPKALAFTISRNGGMACYDKGSNRIIVAIGGAGRDLASFDFKNDVSQLYKNFFPDLVSVEGQRLWISGKGKERKLYIYRGHDSNELWRASLP